MNVPAAAANALAGTYYDEALGTPAIRLLPAEYIVTDQSVALITLLGSCVAACLYDSAIATGGMNHFMLPDGGTGTDVSARYGAHAMELLINDLLKRGARRNRLQAKVFGGGNVLRGFSADPVGTRNAHFVLDYLAAERIPILAHDLGNVHPRKICFFPRTGRALVKHLPVTHDDEITNAERALRQRIASAPLAGSVELF